MCLTNSRNTVLDLKDRHEWMKVYKVYHVAYDTLRSPFQNHRIDLMTNEIVSNHIGGVHCRSHLVSISTGIHVYRTRAGAKEFKVQKEAIVTAWGHTDDLIGANISEAVFTKIYLDDKDWSKWLKKYHPDYCIVD